MAMLPAMTEQQHLETLLNIACSFFLPLEQDELSITKARKAYI